tara:strand:- start:66 stop:422 length:357 start_codon:yes stop_codon:yes gene_type:complete
MSTLSYKIEAYLGREVNFHPVGGEVLLQNDSDGKGDYIKYWSDSIEKSKPTDSQLNAVGTDATNAENLVKVKNTRAQTYPALGEQLDLLYHDMNAGKGDKTGEWFKAVKKVKDDNPKS